MAVHLSFVVMIDSLLKHAVRITLAIYITGGYLSFSFGNNIWSFDAIYGKKYLSYQFVQKVYTDFSQGLKIHRQLNKIYFGLVRKCYSKVIDWVSKLKRLTLAGGYNGPIICFGE